MAALQRAAAARTATSAAAAESGIRKLLKDGGQISFQAVARASGVSAKFLHTNPELSQRIRQLRTQQRGTSAQSPPTSVLGEGAIVAALRRQLREQNDRQHAEAARLRATIKSQQAQLAVLYGQLTDSARRAPTHRPADLQ